MPRIKETTYKYLAGLSDADSSLSFRFNRNADGSFSAGLVYALTQAESNDPAFRHMTSLHEEVGLGNLFRQDHKTNPQAVNWKSILYWQIGGRGELERFLPHIIKHMCVKGGHYQRLLEVRRKLAGNRLTEEQVNNLRRWAKQSRLETGPVKPKNYPSAAWLAGYVDGDGCLHFRPKKESRYVDMHLSINIWHPDMYGVNLIQRAYGGKLYRQTDTTKTYYLNLGVSVAATARKFLHRILPHLRFKKHKAELILAQHRQRLSEGTPTGEATV